jgi:hypothetical protein
MRFIIMVKADAASEAGAMPDESLVSAMVDYHEALAQAGVLLDAAGLQPSAKGWRVDYAQGKRLLTEGPFTQDIDMMAGYTLIQVRSRDEALEWSRRFPAPHGANAAARIEVRQLFELDDLAPGPSTERLRDQAGCAAAPGAGQA